SVAQPRIVVACFLSGECCLRGRNSFAARVFSRSRWTYLANRAATDRFRGLFVIRRDLLYQTRALDCPSARRMAGTMPCRWDYRLAHESHSALRVQFCSALTRHFHANERSSTSRPIEFL